MFLSLLNANVTTAYQMSRHINQVESQELNSHLWSTDASVPVGSNDGAHIHRNIARSGPSKLVKKSAFDRRVFDWFQLQTGLSVLTVSDPGAPKAAAAVDVSCGAMDDPQDLPGLAHFLEHMLFLGSQRYPGEDDFGAFLQENRGSSNAYTTMEHTSYHFHVAVEGFEQALSIFAQFFATPLLSADASAREVRAVQAEHSKNVRSDSWKRQQLLRHLSRSGHKINRFTTGNTSTLRPHQNASDAVLAASLVSLFRGCYCAPNMRVAVVAPLPIDAIQRIVEASFAGVQPTCDAGAQNSPRVGRGSRPGEPMPYDAPYMSPFLGSIIRWETVSKGHSMSIIFQMPSQTRAGRWQVKGPEYFADIIARDGPGSLLALLRGRGLAHGSLDASPTARHDTFELFQISISLTERGVAELYDVLGAVFYVVSLAISTLIPGADPALFESLAEARWLQYSLEETEPPEEAASEFAAGMRLFAPEDVVVAPHMAGHFQPTSIRDSVATYLTPSNVLVLLGGPHESEAPPFHEPTYGTSYWIDPISDEKLREFSDVASLLSRNPWLKGLTLPPHNPFLPRDLDLRHMPRINRVADGTGAAAHNTTSLYHTHPVLLVDEWAVQSAGHAAEATARVAPLRLFWSPDARFGQPTANIIIGFESKCLGASPHHHAVASVLAGAVTEALEHEAAAARNVGFRVSVVHSGERIVVEVGGATGTLPRVLDVVLRVLLDPDRALDAKLLETRRSVLLGSIINEHTQQAHQIAQHALSEALETPMYSSESIADALRRMKPADARNLHSELMQSMAVLALVHGNSNRSDVAEVERVLRNHLAVVAELINRGSSADVGSGSVPPPRVSIIRTTKVRSMPTVLSIPHPSLQEGNSAVVEYFQAGTGIENLNIQGLENGDSSLTVWLMSELLLHLTQNRVFHELRTVQGLGYIVIAKLDVRGGVYG